MATNGKIKTIIMLWMGFQLGAIVHLFGQNTQVVTYTNPILHEDFSDPDVIRVGDTFYMTASSFISVPGLPILASTDLVHWQLVAYALKSLPPANYYQKVHHGTGVWAPSIRYHNGEFYIYYPDPDFGIYMIKSKSITKGWSEPLLILPGKGLIDPCPFWDDNGKAYLVHAFAGSRAGIKSILIMKEMNVAGTAIIGDGKLIYDGHELDQTVEGPKLYKRNGWYYVFAPAGGVQTGWQIVLRSKNIYGPYERKKVMEQGTSSTNGPHQGAWVQTQTGEDWFIHFQDKGPYGRITHLQPMAWKNDWPVIGLDKNGEGVGEPVITYPAPFQKPTDHIEKDENPFQWNANPGPNWQFTYLNTSRNYAVLQEDSSQNLWNFPALYLRKINAEKCTVTTKINFNSFQIGERAGFILFGKSYAAIELKNTENGLVLNYIQCDNADKGTRETQEMLQKNVPASIYFRVHILADAVATFEYSLDGVRYNNLNASFHLVQGVWVGAKMGFYCAANHITNDAGFLEIQSFTIKK